MPAPLSTCRSCGRTIRSGTVYCVPCAAAQADRDARTFDRWLLISLGVTAVMLAAWALYALLGFVKPHP
jgi:hypothetical protein